MGNSANEALIIGVNVLIFILALTISINLMSTVMDMSDKANEIIKTETGTMVESYQDKERIVTGYDLIYYSEDEDMNNKYKLTYGNAATTLSSYLNTITSLNSIMNKQYTMTYKGIEASTKRQIYLFQESL